MLQENSNLQENNALHESTGLPKPNLRTFTEDEHLELSLKYYELDKDGKAEEANSILRQTPVTAEILDVVKKRKGIEYIIKNEINVSKAVEKYGEEWLRN